MCKLLIVGDVDDADADAVRSLRMVCRQTARWCVDGIRLCGETAMAAAEEGGHRSGAKARDDNDDDDDDNDDDADNGGGSSSSSDVRSGTQDVCATIQRLPKKQPRPSGDGASNNRNRNGNAEQCFNSTCRSSSLLDEAQPLLG